MTGSGLKDLIGTRLGVPPHRQRLIFRGHTINDERMIGQDMTEDGQTVHLVQRPDHPLGRPTNATVSAAPPAAGSDPTPQTRFQLRTIEVGQQLPIELSRLLSAVVGAVRHAGEGVAHEVAPGSVPRESSWSMRVCTSWYCWFVVLSIASFWAGFLAWSMYAPEIAVSSLSKTVTSDDNPSTFAWLWLSSSALFLAFTRTLPLYSRLSWFVPPAATQHDQQQNAQMLLGPLMAALIPTSPGLSQELAGQRINLTSNSESSSPPDPVSNTSAENLNAVTPPWQDLQQLSSNLGQLLRRAGPGRALPPANMPHGEFHAFLLALHDASSQLGVAISDIQATLVDNASGEIEQMQLFAATLESGAQVLSRLANSVRVSASSPVESP